MTVLVDLRDVTCGIPERPLFNELSLPISRGDRIGVVGINGTGKSTLLKVIAGLVVADRGAVLRRRDVRVGYLAQEPVLRDGSVAEAVGEDWQAAALLDRVGLAGMSQRPLRELSGGQVKRVALAQVLLDPGDLLVLDEPTNHLDLRAVDWLEGYLKAYSGAVVMVSHDRHLLDRVVSTMLELDRGSWFRHLGGYGSYLSATAEREELAAVKEATRANLARRELAWLRRGAPARTSKAKARVVVAKRLVESTAPAKARTGDLELSYGVPRLGNKVIICDHAGFHYRVGEEPILRNVTLDLDPRERLGIVGLNGSGKSTLLDLLSGKRRPTSGSIERGDTVVVGYYDQSAQALEETARVRDLVAGPMRAPGSPEDLALMERFWFTGDLAFARVATLSGGERRRLQLLLVLARRPNVVLLDEPTNDLDLDSLRMIEDFFDDWPGALVVVSHDRTFLGRSVERLVAVGSTGSVEVVRGGLEGFIDDTRQSKEPDRLIERGRSPQRVARTSARRTGRSPSTLGRLLYEKEKEITKLTSERDRLFLEMAHASDHRVLNELALRSAEVQRALQDSEGAWLELAEEAESST